MSTRLAHVSLLVRDYDEAIQFFVNVLRFRLVEDTALTEEKRWVVVAPSTAASTSLLLAKAANDEQLTYVGNQTGGRVFLFLETDDFESDFHHLQSCGVEFVNPPRKEPYGAVAVFKDLYGNTWDLSDRREEPNQYFLR